MVNVAEIEKEKQIREEIPTEKVKSAFIKAGAGAGKTSLLVERVYQQLVRGVEPVRIAAITFTNKAANEMYDRVSLKLKEREEKLEPGEERERVTRARRQMEEMHISTIHSFCRTIVMEFPFFAGLSMDVKELENAEVAALQQEFLRRFLQDCMDQDEQGEKNLWHYHEQASENMRALRENMGRSFPNDEYKKYIYDPQKLGSKNGMFGMKLESVLTQKESGKRPVMTPAEAEAEAEQIRQDAKAWLEEIFDGLAAQLRIRIDHPDTKPSTRNKLESGLEGIANNDVSKLLPLLKGKATELAGLWGEREQVKTAEDFLFRGYAHKRQEWMESLFGDTKEMEPLRDWWDGVRQQYLDGLLGLEQRYVEFRCRMILGLFRELTEAYLQYEDQEKIIGNHNIVYRALQIVRNDEAVARRIAERFDTIYIDEYQDTDAQQAAFFQRLWEASEGRLKLFYIGDAKQSIYAFRGADPTQFKNQEQAFRAAEDEGADDRRVYELHFNYRSNHAICEWVSEEFKTDYPGEDMISMSPSQKCHDSQLYGVYRFPLSQEAVQPEEQAKETADLVRRLIDSRACIWVPKKGGDSDAAGAIRPVRPSDFLLLFWKTDNMELYQRELREQGFQISMDGRVHFSRNQAYQALTAILEYCVYRRKYYRYQALALCPSLTGAALEGFCDLSERMLPAAFVRMLSADDRLYEGVRNRAEAFAGISHAVEEAAQSQYTDLGEFLKQLPKDKKNDHTLPLKQEGEEHIRLMNVHKAKGLEGKIVICCEVHNARQSDASSDQDREQYRNLEYVLYTRAQEALIFLGQSLPEDRSAQELDLQRIRENRAEIAEDFSEGSAEKASAVSIEGCSSWEAREESLDAADPQAARQGSEDGFREREEQWIPSRRRVSPSLDKRKMQEQQPGAEGSADMAEEEEEKSSLKREHAERPYGSRLGLILHRVMELAVNERKRLCPAAEQAQKEQAARMPEAMRRIVEPLLRFAVAEELQTPLTAKDRTELRLSGEESAVQSDQPLLEKVCDAVREYVFAFLYSVYIQQEYRHFISECEVYTELPFFVHGQGTDGGEELIHGIMDLVIREKDAYGKERYIVADYKTTCQYVDETQEEYLQRLHEKYDRQLELYQKILRDLFRIPEEIAVDTIIVSYYIS